MRIDLAGPQDVPDLARLLRGHASAEERAQQAMEPFAADLADWWQDHADSHVAFLARTDDGDVVGMLWLALLPRPPRPGTTTRVSADVQSVYVEPEHRGAGIATALVQAAWEHATQRGARRVTVSSSTRAVPMYGRLGFLPSPQLLERDAGPGASG